MISIIVVQIFIFYDIVILNKLQSKYRWNNNGYFKYYKFY